MGEFTSIPERRLRSQPEHLSVAIARRKDPMATNLEPEAPAMAMVETIAAITGPIIGVVIVVVTQTIVIIIAAVAIIVITDGDSRGADSLIQAVYFRGYRFTDQMLCYYFGKTVSPL